MNRRQRDHRELVISERLSKGLYRCVLSSFNTYYKKTTSSEFGKRFGSSTKAIRYSDFMEKNRWWIEC